LANIIIFFIISLSSFDNLWFVGSFDNILVFFPLNNLWFVGFFDNLWFVGSFDNTLVFFLLIIINLWFVCFFDDSIRVRLVTLHYIKQKCLPEASWLYWCH